MRFSCARCGRTYVAPEKVRGRAFKMTCRDCGNVIVVHPRNERRDDLLPGLPPEPPEGPIATPAIDLTAAVTPPPPKLIPPDDPFAPGREPSAPPPEDPFAPARTERPPLDPFVEVARESGVAQGPAGATREPAPGGDEADAAFADLAREMEQSGARRILPEGQRPAEPPASERTPVAPRRAPDAPKGERSPPSTLGEHLFVEEDFQTGERPLHTEGVTPSRAAAPAQKPAQHPPARTAASRPAVVKKRSPVLPIAVAAVAMAMAGSAWLYFRTGEPAMSPAKSKPAPSPAPVTSAPPPRPAPPSASAPLPVAPQPSAAAPLPSPPVAAAPQEPAAPPDGTDELEEAEEEEPATASAKGSPKRKSPEKASARKKQRPAPQKPAAKPAAPAKPPPAPEPRVALAPGPAPAPTASPAPPRAPGSEGADLPPLDEAKVEAAFSRSLKGFEACVDTARTREPGIALGGRTVTVTMTVNPDGKVLYPTLDDAELNATELGKCIKRESGKIQFPAFGGAPVRVRKPILLK